MWGFQDMPKPEVLMDQLIDIAETIKFNTFKQILKKKEKDNLVL